MVYRSQRDTALLADERASEMVLVPMDPPNMKRGEQSIYSASSIYSGVRRSRVEQEVEAPDLAKERAHDFDDESLEDDSASDEDYDADDNDGQYDDADDEEEQRMRKKGIYHMGDIVDPDYSHKTYLLSSYGVDNRGDNYDYEQHLREIGKGTFVEAEGPDEVPKADAAAATAATAALGKLSLGFEGQHALQLPTEVFASGKEQAVGLMNLEAPTGLDLSVDPDIVRALETFSSDEADELEDNFIFLANASGDDGDGDAKNPLHTAIAIAKSIAINKQQQIEIDLLKEQLAEREKRDAETNAILKQLLQNSNHDVKNENQEIVTDNLVLTASKAESKEEI